MFDNIQFRSWNRKSARLMILIVLACLICVGDLPSRVVDVLQITLYITVNYRAKWTAGHLHVSDAMCIVIHMSALKTNAHVGRFEFWNLHLFFCIRSSNAEERMVIG